ncbi:serine/threonine protein kinase [Nocardioides sp. ChNu-153]|uniref:serine/threonine-protein kinase n=1 Tax=unclassified Nocardioides TaxID=2615069 RepID=UPI0024053C8B|nr:MULTISPECIES: serine/threonine-protein kinase [unclassified Nocardioides]MDF9717047.1 serine/threonine protein kinase [Nocardioides sp. ChNu-99]MDN7122241.1 serine/threonine protein kinase [Nocardioides sp. ChNu-153]
MVTTDPDVLADRYALLELIGSGGMADVHRARDRVLERDVAVKVLRDPGTPGTDRDRFAGEARTLAALSHPGLVTVLDAGTDGGRPFLVMQLVRGSTLREHCSGGAMSPARVAHVGAQIADALAYVHAAGVVHRDVKPGNVLVGADDRAWLADFGIARLMGDAAQLTRAGAVIGSPAYLSPEQVRGEPGVTAATDLYSLGLVLLEALTGRQVYAGPPTEAALARLARSPAVPTHLGGAWARLLSELTATDPDRRPDAARVAVFLSELADAPAPRGAAGGTSASPVLAPADGSTSTQAWQPAFGTATPPADLTAAVLAPATPAAVAPTPAGPAPRVTHDATGSAEPFELPGSGSHPDTARGTREATPVPRRRTARRWGAVVAAAALVAVGLVTFLPTEEAVTADAELPAEVPAELRGPLEDLHDAIEGTG